ncbi:diguanylate cyclase [bacterium]|nr:diguanylate cyclase [bacterium]
MAETILLADDDPKTIELLRVLLETKGYDLIWTRDGEETLQKARDEKPDLILMDVMMPKLNGYEVAHLLKENLETKDMAIIFVSAKSEQSHKITGLKMGGHDYITKPFDIYELMARVEAALRIKNSTGPLHRGDRRFADSAVADPLTGLYNKKYYLERFEEELARARKYSYPVACVLITVDRFEEIGENFGRLQSDQVLQRIALLLKKSNRVVDMIGCYNEKTFIVQLTQTDAGGARVVAQRFAEQIKRVRLVSNDPNYKISLSLGVAALSGGASSGGEEIIQQTQAAMHRAMAQGGDCVAVANEI